MQLAPVIAANDQLPIEMIVAADRLSDQIWDLVFRSSTLCLQIRRADARIDSVQQTIALAADEIRACAKTADSMAAIIAALEAKAIS